MKRDSRLSGVLHVLLHMAEQSRPVTSEVLATAMCTNPVVIRRVMAGLRDEGYVRSEKGHGGGWTLACDLEKVTLRDIYDALGSPVLLAMGNRTESPGCLVEQAVNAALDQTFRDAEALLLARLGETWVFVEVRTRRSEKFGRPEASLTTRKRAHLVAAAQHYLQAHELADVPWRIDVVAVDLGLGGRPRRVDVIENAVTGG